MNNSKLFYRLGVLVHNLYFKKILFLCTFTKLQIVNTTFIVSVHVSLICLPVRLEQLGCHWLSHH